MQHPSDPRTPTEFVTPSLDNSPQTPHQGDTILQTPAVAKKGPEVRVVIMDGEGIDGGGISTDKIRGMKRRFAEIEGQDGSEELKGMVRSLLPPCLDDLPFLQQQLAAQSETIRTMQQQARLSEQLMSIERSRMAAERQSWHASTQAMLKQKEDDIASGVRPNRLLHLDVGYHQELEAANKRLEMDNRLMAPRLADTQRQIDKLVTELQHLRSHVVLSSHHFDSHPTYLPPMDSRQRSRSPVKTIRSTTMGDARTEHLLLAARKVRAMRQTDDRVGRLTLEELKKGGVVGPDGGLGYSEGYGGIFEEEADDEGESEMEEKLPERRVSFSGKKSHKKKPPTTPGNTAPRQPLTTPGGSNFNDLIRAAELAGSPMPASQSATRDDRPAKKSRKGTAWSRTQRIDGMTEPAPADKSALDLLLQASQIDSEDSESDKVMPPPGLAPALELRDHVIDPALADLPRPTGRTIANAQPYQPPTLATPRQRPRGLSNASAGGDITTPRWAYHESPFDESRDSSPPLMKRERFESIAPVEETFNSPTGGTVPGLGKYVHLTNSMPARRMRSPYLKWTVEEDELLARAVALHGEKWDLVSKGVPTRSYHQVRQRWLRKTGAFDKKQALSGLGNDGGQEELEQRDTRAGSPTPLGGSQAKADGKKRRMSLLGQ